MRYARCDRWYHGVMILNAQKPLLDDEVPVFTVGQVVKHKRYGYRGVIVEVDLRCQATDQWYQKNQTQPSRDQPWYHVLVDGSTATTYPAQENLTLEPIGEPIEHPWLDQFFSIFLDGRYIRNDRPWPPE